jgi:hypothetical protein
MNYVSKFLSHLVAMVLLWGILYGLLTAVAASAILFYTFYAFVAVSAYKLYACYSRHACRDGSEQHNK